MSIRLFNLNICFMYHMQSSCHVIFVYEKCLTTRPKCHGVHACLQHCSDYTSLTEKEYLTLGSISLGMTLVKHFVYPGLGTIHHSVAGRVDCPSEVDWTCMRKITPDGHQRWFESAHVPSIHIRFCAADRRLYPTCSVE